MIVLCALLSLVGPILPAGPTRPEMRGRWVVRTGLVSPQAVDDVVDGAVRGGFNALFVQVRGRGDAFYASRLVPRSELLRGQPADFDPLGRLIARARGRGLQVHAWVNVLLCAHFGLALPAAPLVDPGAWGNYRRAALDTLAARLSRAARDARPGLVVSAAVVPDLAQALYHEYQAWPEWMARGLVDAVCPMAYTADTRVFRAQLEAARARPGPTALPWAGGGA